VIDWVELRCGGCTAVGGEVESRCDRLTRGYLALRRVGEVKAEVKVVVPCRSCCLRFRAGPYAVSPATRGQLRGCAERKVNEALDAFA
jgi:hypothetical protein